MNWNDLRVFLAIADAGSLAGAARSLGFNHSTVFRRLNALEGALGVRLFDRFPEGYALTPVGERMLELTREADCAIQQVEIEVAGRDLAPAGIVRLTTAPNIARTLVPSAVRSLRKTHPGVLVEIAVGDTDYNLSRREADIALRATTTPPEHLIGRKLMDLGWWVCASTSARTTMPTGPGSMRDTPLIGADPSLMRLKAFQWLESGYKNNIVARANDLSTMAALTIAGVGCSILPSDQNERRLRRLFPVPNVSGELWLLTHPELRKVRRIDAVWNALIAAVQVGQA